MKDLNMKSFYRHEVPVNRKKTDITVNKQNIKGINKASLRVDLQDVYHKDAEANHQSVKAPITHYDDMLSDNLFSN